MKLIRNLLHKPVKPVLRTPLKQHHRIISKQTNEVVCDFTLIDDPRTNLEAIIVLNNELNHRLFNKCVPLAQNIILADGGANHFYNSPFQNSDKVRAIVGDFDCISPQVFQYYAQKAIPLEYMSSIEANDFSKALQRCLRDSMSEIFCFGAFGGRMDQTLSGMHYCQKYSKLHPQLQIILLGQSNLMFHLRKNVKYRILISQQNISNFGCGLITFGKADYVETTGFKYNLGYDEKYKNMEWGKFISTSNEIVDESCTIISNSDLFFVANYSHKIMA